MEAAGQGNGEAQLCAGIMYAHGIGVSKNRDEAKIWLKKAANQGYVKAEGYLKELKG